MAQASSITMASPQHDEDFQTDHHIDALHIPTGDQIIHSNTHHSSSKVLVPNKNLQIAHQHDSLQSSRGISGSYGASLGGSSVGSMASVAGCVDITPSVDMGGKRPTSNMFAAVLVCITCNVIFGPIALTFAVISRKAYKRNEMDRGKNYSDAALWTSVFGLLTSLVIVLLVVIFVVII